MTNNKTDNDYKLAITICYFALIVIGLIGIVLIILFRPDATATMIQTVITILTLGSTAAVTFYMLGKIITNTNGANTALRDENAKLTAQLLSVVGSAPSVSSGSVVNAAVDTNGAATQINDLLKNRPGTPLLP